MGRLSVELTRGPLLPNILRFALPLMATNLLQMLFNAADVVVVGQFAGYGSMAAVGSTSATVFLFTNLLIGLGIGVNVLVAHYAGAGGKDREISLTLHTAMTLGAFGGVALALVGIGASRWILTLMHTPADIFDKTCLYLQIYFIGTPFVMLYNYGTAVLRAIGDTRRPFLFLLASGLTNLVLNLYFVIFLHWDVAGVGIATVISQLLSAVLVLHCLAGEKGPWQYHWRRLALDGPTLKELFRIGLPAGLQACLFSLSNVVIQGALNVFGSVVVAANSAGSNVENLLYIAMNSFHQASLTFIAQNLGARQWPRVKQVTRLCLQLTVGLGLLEWVLIQGCAPELIRLFNGDSAVVAAGTERLMWVGRWYVLFGCADVLIGSIRGFGISVAPMLINLLGTCAFRLVWIGCLDLPACGVEKVYLSYPLSWLLILVILIGYATLLYRQYEKKFAGKQADTL